MREYQSSIQIMRVIQILLIGIWHAVPSTDDVFDFENDMFFFYKDKSFKLSYGKNNEDNILYLSGKWDIYRNKELKLEVEEIGFWEDSSDRFDENIMFSTNDETYIRKKLKVPSVDYLKIEKFRNDTDLPFKSKIKIDDQFYWKICEDPDDEHYNQRIEEIEETFSDLNFDE